MYAPSVCSCITKCYDYCIVLNPLMYQKPFQQAEETVTLSRGCINPTEAVVW